MEFPEIIYGAAQRVASKPPLTSDAITMGYRAFDTSNHDICNDIAVGEIIHAALNDETAETKISRGEIVLQAKYSPASFYLTKPAPYSPSDEIPLQILKSLASSLRNLQTEYLDVYFLHRPFSTLNRTLAAWEVMEETVRQGVARCIALSQIDIATLQTLHERSDIKPSVVQNYFAEENHYDVAVRRYCRVHGIGYQAFGVLGGRNERLRARREVSEVSARYAVGEGAALIACVLAAARRNGERFSVLDGSKDLGHMRENLRAVGIAKEVAKDGAFVFAPMLLDG